MASVPNRDSGSLSWSKRRGDRTWKLLRPLLRERRGSFPSIVNKQGDVVGIINVRESMLANLDADSTTDVLRDEVHCSAEQPGSVWGLTHSLGEGGWGGARVTKPMSGYVPILYSRGDRLLRSISENMAVSGLEKPSISFYLFYSLKTCLEDRSSQN